MVTLVIVKNPFSPQDGREVKRIEYDGTIGDLKKEYAIEGVELQGTINGYSVADDTKIKDNDFVVVYPVIEKGDKGGKGILGIIAAIALSVVSMGIATGGWLGAAHGAFAAGHWGAYLAAAAVMFMGSSLIGRMTGQKVDNGDYDNETDATYSWGDVQTMEGQNNSIALTYGTVKSGGQTIGKYVSIDDNEEYLNWLVACGEGELNIYDIRLNDNDASDYDDVEVEVRNGTNDQDIINNFNNTYSSKNLNYKLDSSWATDSVSGTGTRGLVFTIEFPNGLYHYSDSGKLQTAWVTLDIEYKASGGSWKNLFKEVSSNDYGIMLVSNIASGNYAVTISGETYTIENDSGREIEYFGGYTIKIGDSTTRISKAYIKNKVLKVGAFSVDISKWSNSVKNTIQSGGTITSTLTVSDGTKSGYISAKTRSALRKQFAINKIAAGEYQIRVKVKSRQYPLSDQQSASECYWTMVTSVVYDDFTYPCTALIGIKAKATDQLSGSPSLTFMKQRKKVWVWNGSSYVKKNANNPAWACYDLLHQARQLKNINTNANVTEVRGVPKERMRYADFAAWAAWCSTMKLYVNIEINTVGEMLDVANQKIAPIGRGLVVRFGTKYGCIYDHVQDPVQMFNMGNIKQGTFSEEFLKVSDRANCVEITYTNADADYQRDVLTIYGDTFNTDGYAKTAQMTFDGITSYTQAYREGKYQLMCNKYQLRTVSFEADIDSIACTVGDVVLVAHDVPKWANSGRIEKVENNIITLPCYVSDLTKSYRIQYRTQNDNLYTKACTIVSTTEDGWTTVSVSDTSDMPQAGDVYDLAIANIGSKPFVIKSITRAQDFTRRITCIEYAESLFDESYEIPPIQYAVSAWATPKNVGRLSASQYCYTDSFQTKHSVMSVSWQKPDNGGKFSVFISPDMVSWRTMVSQTESDNVEFETEPGMGYYVKVITIQGLAQSNGTVSGWIPAGIDKLPPDITEFDAENLASGLRRFWWKFVYPTPNDIAGFRIKYTQAQILIWEKGILAQDGLITSQPFETMMIRQGYNTVMIKAVDNAGQESKNFAYCVLDVGDLLAENVLWKKDFSLNNWQDVMHDGVVLAGAITSNNNGLMWTRDAARWMTATDYAWEPQLDTLHAEMQFTAVASGQFWIKASIEGPGIIYYSTSSDSGITFDIEKQWSDKVMVSAGDVIKVKVVGINDGNKGTKIKSFVAYIDVPDIIRHFEDLPISAGGTELPLDIPNYYTEAVRLDAIQNSNAVTVKYISKTPCVIQLLDSNGIAVAGTADITWQGYQREVVT